MSFQKIILLHGKGGSPEGSVKEIEGSLRRRYPELESSFVFERPRLLHSAPEVLAEDSLADLRGRQIAANTVLIGVSLGGLLAASLQEQDREDLRVICINSPTWADGVKLERRMADRIAFYSSSDEVIAGRTQEWPRLATAHDLPWLTHDSDLFKEEFARLIFAWLNGASVPHAIAEVEQARARNK